MKIFVILLSFSLYAYAAFETFDSNAFLCGLGGSMVTGNNYFSAFLLNPATSATSQNFSLGFSYSRPFGLDDLNHANLIMNLPIKKFGTGIAFSNFGNNLYQENRLSFNLSRTFLQNKLFIGINLHWYKIRIERYPDLATLGTDIGFQWEISPVIYTGFSIKNFNHPNLNGHKEEIPIQTLWGISVKPEDQFTFHLALQKDRWFPINFLMGIEFEANRFLSIQSGFNSYPTIPSIGIQLHKSVILVTYSFQYHIELGGTHYWGISFNKKP